jgi:hypothetical protein
MRTGSHRRSLWLGASPPPENISDGILAHGQPSFFAASDEPRARLEIRRRKYNSRYRGRIRFGNRSKFLDFFLEKSSVHF